MCHKDLTGCLIELMTQNDYHIDWQVYDLIINMAM